MKQLRAAFSRPLLMNPILAGVMIISILSLSATIASAVDRPTAEFPLWPNDAPAALGKAETDVPTLTPFWAPAEKATGAVMIVCPGGGYNVLEIQRVEIQRGRESF